MPKYSEMALIFGDVLTEARAATFESQYRLAKERARPLGGIPEVAVTDDAYVDIPGVILVLMEEATTAQVHAMGSVSAVSPAPTGSLRLWNATDSAVVAGSEIDFIDTVPTLQMTPDLELLAGKQYKLQIKVNVDTEYVLVYGASLVTQ